ncbi:LEA type 2 family protein [Catalinimonas niigatensis]|uniref:LEA type 2 family protein n=1 Tax=Catalinimonas niigatensis TaxID=1397264 RepID=UPI0026650E58|nr:LEA type 2 family protein [Catalinimonas niigatensis]WPP51593.1 LEA type 2 family protein [Catalinimonas niigatensis]
MRKGIFIITGIVVIGLVFYLVIGNKQSEKESSDTFILPKLEVLTFQIKSFEEERILLEMQTMIDNKMPLSFQIDSLSYRVLMEGTEIIQSTYPDSILLEANDNSQVDLPLTLYQQKISSTMEEIEQQNADSIAYELYARLYTDLPAMEGEPIELNFTKQVPFIKRPEINLEGASIEKFGLETSEITLTVQVINPNQFSFQIRDTNYDFRVKGDSLVSGNIEKTTSIASYDTTSFEVPIKLQLEEVGESAFNLLFNPEETNYSFTISSTLESQLDMLNNSTLKIENSGKLKDLLN